MSTAPDAVLLADDDAVSRLMVAAALEAGGFSVIEVEDGAAAVEAFDQRRPAAVILDVVMPRMNGYEACEMIRKHPIGHEVPILMLTSRDDVDAVDRAYDAGATDFATKGISHRLLTKRIRFLLRADALRSEVAANRRRMHQVRNLARVGHWELDAAGRTVDASDIAASIVGTADQQLGHVDQLRSTLEPAANAAFTAALEEWRTMARPFRLDLRMRNGTHLSVSGAPCQTADMGTDAGLMLAIQDTTALHEAREQARRLASEDTVTGLPNRSGIVEALTTMLDAQPHDNTIAVAILRISGYSRMLTTYEGSVVDVVLRRVGDRLEAAVPLLIHPAWGSVTLATAVRFGHLGGGQFIALLQGCADAEAATLILLEQLQRPIEGPDWLISPESRAGIALWPHDGRNADDLIKSAVATAAHAQIAGARQLLHSPEIRAAAVRRKSIELALRRAAQDHLLWIAYQPRISLDDLHIRGVEALLRFMHPNLGLVSPAEFIPIAEEAGLIVELGTWVLQSACAQAARWRRDLKHAVDLSVNVSANQLGTGPEFVRVVRGALADTGLPPACLELELTESMIIHADQNTRHVLDELRSLGVRVALDDFGTGYSSLGYLSQLPIDCLKIDRSFIASLQSDPAAQGITHAVLAMARSLQLRTVGEGIENKEQLAFLRDNGCDEGQGFLFSKPLPADDISLLLKLPPDVERLLPQLRAG